MTQPPFLIPDLAPEAMHRDEETIHRSRFIVSVAHVTTDEEAHAFIERIRAEHAEATHNCWAYVAGPPGSTAHVGASDDGEPKGTAGRPMLTVLLHCGVGEVAVVVTRYFGGILLGTGGLVRAYQGLTKKGIEGLAKRERVPSEVITLTVEHRFYNLVQYELDAVKARVLNKDFGMDVVLTVDVPQTKLEALLATLVEKTAANILIERETEKG